MKKKNIIQKILLVIIGITIGGGISVLASNYILKASDIKYNENKTVQQAVEELYSKADKIKGSNEALPVGNPIIAGYKIIIPYTGDYQNVKCVYGTTDSYGQEGTIENNTCSFKGTNSDQKLYYKIVATNITDNIDGKIYEYSGSNITGTCDNFDDDKNCITKTTYQTGDAITLGGYKWHVIGDEGTKLTLLMDANQLGSNSTMGHCGSSIAFVHKSKCCLAVEHCFRSVDLPEHDRLCQFFGKQRSADPDLRRAKQSVDAAGVRTDD